MPEPELADGADVLFRPLPEPDDAEPAEPEPELADEPEPEPDVARCEDAAAACVEPGRL